MNAIRQYHKIDETREIKISIPEDFLADEVEVIVLPTKLQYEISEETKKMVMERWDEYCRNPDDVQGFDETIENVRKRINNL
ncbi:hypothetical protein SDC9_126948 [bioreactor metagenome]|uniref:Addiction module component n=1 Tax=bioreactor metagenome TaxID=1076179 RepID=A0A645CSN3_9ZZZZ